MICNTKPCKIFSQSATKESFVNSFLDSKVVFFRRTLGEFVSTYVTTHNQERDQVEEKDFLSLRQSRAIRKRVEVHFSKAPFILHLMLAVPLFHFIEEQDPIPLEMRTYKFVGYERYFDPIMVGVSVGTWMKVGPSL